MDTDELVQLMGEATRILQKRPTITHTDGNILAVGDVHGDIDSTKRAIELREKLQLNQVVFIGDFVDRGVDQLGTLVTLMRELVTNPDRIQLIRGNHEDIAINQRYGFLDELKSKGIDVKTIIQPLGELYSSMPVAAIMGHTAFIVHGGIPYYDGEINIWSISRGGPQVDPFDDCFGLLWNDPAEAQDTSPDRWGENRRGSGIYTFSKKVVDEFLDKLGLQYLIRGHIVQKNGFCWYNDRTLSLFSANSGKYSDIKVAYAKVSDQGIKIVR